VLRAFVAAFCRGTGGDAELGDGVHADGDGFSAAGDGRQAHLSAVDE